MPCSLSLFSHADYPLQSGGNTCNLIHVVYRLAAEFDSSYIGQVDPASTPLYPGVAGLVRRLVATGTPTGCLTNAARGYARAVADAHGFGFLSVHGAYS